MKLTKIINGTGVSGALLALLCSANAAMAQQTPPPVRDPHTPGFVASKDLPDGTIPTPNDYGNFVIGPTHTPSPDMMVQPNVPQGQIFHFTVNSSDSKIFPGIMRDRNTVGTPDPANPASLIVTTSHASPNISRNITVYVPSQYVPGTAAPFIVTADGDKDVFPTLNNLIAQGKVPAMIAIAIPSGGGDAQGSERGLEYDTMSGLYAEWVEKEILPMVESTANVKLTKDPDGRATMGGSSGGSCALIMAWYHPDLYHRVLTYSGTFVNQQWPYNPQIPGGAWEFAKSIIPNTKAKPLRIFIETGDKDLLNPNNMRDDMHDWTLSNELMAKALADKKYKYQFIFAQNAGHVDGKVKRQTLPEALEWLWKGYKPAKGNK